jgi:hypothetical protein
MHRWLRPLGRMLAAHPDGALLPPYSYRLGAGPLPKTGLKGAAGAVGRTLIEAGGQAAVTAPQTAGDPDPSVWGAIASGAWRRRLSHIRHAHNAAWDSHDAKALANLYALDGDRIASRSAAEPNSV